MTDIESWINLTCDRIVASGHVRLYRDLYKDLRERMPCALACRLIAEGLILTRFVPSWSNYSYWGTPGPQRARAIAALARLERYAANYPYTRCPDCGNHMGKTTNVDGCCGACVEQRRGDGR